MLNKTPPLWSPRWRYEDGKLEYKPYPRYPTWLIAWDVSDIMVAIEAVAEIASEAGIAAVAAQTDATTAIANAASAQATADAALAAAGGAASPAPTFGVMVDEFVWNTTPTRQVGSTYPYNYAVFTSTPAAATKKIEVQAGTWNIHILTYKGTTAGQLTVDLAGVTILLNLELYVASPAFAPYVHNLTGVTISSSGWHDLTISCSSKHGSSSAWGLIVFKIWGERTGA